MVGLDCEDGSERNRVFQKVDLQVNPCSSERKTGEIELKQRCMGVVMVLMYQEPGYDVG